MRAEMAMNGGEAVARALATAGVRSIFTLHGGHLDAVYRACLDLDINLVDARHEASAGHAAEGWARITGELGVCMITAGPGFTNTLTAITNAFLDGTPTLFLIGAPPLREAGLNILQGGVDQIAMAKPVAKLAIQITEPDRIPDQIATAITIACSGKPGPVVVELPIDVLAKSCTSAGSLRKPVHPSPSVPAPEDVTKAISLLSDAESPVLVLGNLARYEASPSQIEAFVHQTGIPVVASTRALGMLDPENDAYAHTLDSLAVAAATGVGTADVALMLGSRHGLFMGGRSDAYLTPSCAIIHVHADPFEFSAVREPSVASTANCGAFLDAIAVGWRKDRAATEEWRRALAGVPAIIHGMFSPATPSGRIHPYHAASETVAHCPKDAIFVLEGGETGFWAGYHVRAQAPGGVQTFGQLGALGIGMGMAIGAAAAAPDKRIVQITGDGAMGFHLQEFDTFVRHNLPVVTVILNNDAWGMSLHGQQMLYGENYDCISVLPDIAYEEAARGLGCYAERVSRIEDIGPAMERAFASGRPACINVATAPEIILPATAAMLGEAKPDEIMVPYYENIPA